MQKQLDLPQKVLVLGSTGSIGVQTLDVARRHPDKLQIVGLACGGRVKELAAQAEEFDVHAFAFGDEGMVDSAEADTLRSLASAHADGFLSVGSQAVTDLIAATDADIIINALVGAHGLRASITALESGARLALANKESLVVAGDLIMPLVKAMDTAHTDDVLSGAIRSDHARSGDVQSMDEEAGDEAVFQPSGRLTPIDSEHGAIFQCLLGERMDEISKLWITASGGPFRGKKAEQLKDMTAQDALAHPTWNMGPKITIDSSTLMNKGLEVIEAHHLFAMPYDKIEVVVQPQSTIHSMVEFIDGSVKAHLGTTDMRIPIQFALSYPRRWDSPVSRMDFRTLGSLDFDAPDTETFKCLKIAYEAGRVGGTMPCAMNAANEVAVLAFLQGACGFLDIADCVMDVVSAHHVCPVESVEQLEEVDAQARRSASEFLRKNCR